LSKSVTYIVEGLIREINGENEPKGALDKNTLFISIK